MPAAFAGKGSVKPMISDRSMLSRSMECAVPFAWSASFQIKKSSPTLKLSEVESNWLGSGEGSMIKRRSRMAFSI
jgi:hypothetical protein